MKGFGRRGSAVIAAGIASVVVVALGITASAASYTDQEFVQGPVGTLDCDAPGEFNTQAWGQVVSAELLGAQLDPIVELDGLTVTNHETVPANDPLVSDPSLLASTDLTDNAWASPISATLLDLINAQIGLGFFDSPDVGAYTQYGDAETDGTSTGAAGVLTTSEGGVALGSTDPEAPGIAHLDLSDLLAEVIGDQLAGGVAQLADLSLDVGAVASSTTMDACAPLWSGADLASSVVRDYLIASLALSFESELIDALVTDITGVLTALDTALDINVNLDAALLADLDDLLGAINLGVLGVDLGSITSATASVNVDLSSVIGLLTGQITDTGGLVVIDLDSGLISIDLAKITDSVNGVNMMPPNSPIITPAVINAILNAIQDAVADFVNDVLDQAIQQVLDLATVSINIDALLTINTPLGNVAGVNLHIDADGPLSGPLVVDATVSASGGVLTTLGGILGILGINLNTLLGTIASGLEASLVVDLIPGILENLALQLDAIVDAALQNILGPGGLVPELLLDLTPVFNFLRNIVDITVNVRPDFAPNPDAPVPPDIPVPGRYFESAIRISLLDPTITAPDGLVEVYLANSSAGPNTPR